eukprot:6139783-Pyramimonas_sp.AAC.1
MSCHFHDEPSGGAMKPTPAVPRKARSSGAGTHSCVYYMNMSVIRLTRPAVLVPSPCLPAGGKRILLVIGVVGLTMTCP